MPTPSPRDCICPPVVGCPTIPPPPDPACPWHRVAIAGPAELGDRTVGGEWNADPAAVHPCGTQVVWQRLVWGDAGERTSETLECTGPYSHPGWHRTDDGRLFEARLIADADRTEARVEADDARLAEELRVRGWLVERAECGNVLEGALVPGALREYCNRPTGHVGRHRSPEGTEWSPPLAPPEAPVVDWRGAEGRVRVRPVAEVAAGHAKGCRLDTDHAGGCELDDQTWAGRNEQAHRPGCRLTAGHAGPCPLLEPSPLPEWAPPRPGPGPGPGQPALTADGQLLRDADDQVVGMMTAPSWARSVARYARVAAVLEGADTFLADLAAVLGDDG